MKIASFFTGAGGLDLGFEKAGFEIIYANENDKKIFSTFEKNFPKTKLDKRSITKVESEDVPDCDGIIGGPPCQSWSEAGALRGINDLRGQLFFDFIRIIKDKQPKFFLAENVSGMLAPRNADALKGIVDLFRQCGYVVSYKLLNASDYGVPQDRKRVIFVGIRNDLNTEFVFPKTTTNLDEDKITLKDCIYDLADNAIPAQTKNYANNGKCKILNHEYMIGSFSPIYMSRNRVRPWDKVSYTIQAGGRHAPIHPQAPEMVHVGKNKKIFKEGFESFYRRLSVRECARIQTFPDTFEFVYNNVTDGYKMIGNAVPVEFAKILASQFKEILK
jgi:DNA (cytosine-5)-methyltransferase 1